MTAAKSPCNLVVPLSEEPRPGASRKLSGKEEALLVATACSKPPQGRARWTLECGKGGGCQRSHCVQLGY
jgi:hypothetical protein